MHPRRARTPARAVLLRCLAAAAAALVALCPGGCGSDGNPAEPPGPGADVSPPAVVTDLAVADVGDSSLTLRWTAPGDDGQAGSAAAYEIRHTDGDDPDWTLWTALADPPAPLAGGATQTCILSGLAAGQTRRVRLRARDEAGNWSGVSNLAVGTPRAAGGRTWHVDLAGTGDAPTIQAAIDSAAAGDLVLVAPGRYTWDNQGTGTEFALVSFWRGRTDFELRGEGGAAVTILDAQGHNRVMWMAHENRVTVDGFTFTGGVAGERGYHYGGGLLTHMSHPTIRNCVFTGNSAVWGGGLQLDGWGDHLLENCHVHGNTAEDYGGGVMGASSGGDSAIRDCVIEDNEARYGGGICSRYFRVEITGCLVRDNTAGEAGGGICFLDVAPDYVFPMAVARCTIVDNYGREGGGIAALGLSELTVTGSIIAASRWGGAVALIPVPGYDPPQLRVGCCDLFGNVGGDALPPGTEDLGANFSLAPGFCSGEGIQAQALAADSPCAAGHHPAGAGCGTLGAVPVGCAR